MFVFEADPSKFGFVARSIIPGVPPALCFIGAMIFAAEEVKDL